MTLEELSAWKETWEEQLYLTEYATLPNSMEECLFGYFENGGTLKDFNDTYSFGENEMDIEDVKELLNELFESFEVSDDSDIEVIVVTNTENGWDCVVGVYMTSELAEEDYPDEAPYVYHTKILEK